MKKKSLKMALLVFSLTAIWAVSPGIVSAKEKTKNAPGEKFGKPIGHGNKKRKIPKIDGRVKKVKVKIKEGDVVSVKITGYYGPKPGQKRYATGSYRGDLALNGRGEKTSSGKTARPGIAAADPDVFPIGSVIFIPGVGKLLVADTGEAIKGARIDIFTGHGENALKKALEINRQAEATVIRLAKKKE